MADIERLTAAYESMNPWARKLLRDLAEDYAKLFPASQPAAHLRFVQAAAQERILSGADSAARSD